jgi:Methane oxygenase PmoA
VALTAGGLQLAHVHESHFDVSFDGALLARYVYRPDFPPIEALKPYIEPVRTLGGDLVTAYRPHDHVWHKGIQLALPHVGDQNIWGGYTWVRDEGRYIQLDNNGSMEHEAFAHLTAGTASVEVAETLGWFSAGGERMADERREVAFDVSGAGDGAWVLSFASTIRNCGDDPLVFSSPTVEGRPDAGYGGLTWRGPRSFTGGEIVASEGRSGPELMGERGKWLGFVGRHDGSDSASTVVFVDEADAPQVPTTWFVRSEPYAIICASPFFHEAVAVPAHGSLRFAWSVIVADGAWGAEDIERFIAAHGVDRRRGSDAGDESGAER